MLYCPKCGRHYPVGSVNCVDDGALLHADSTVAAAIPVDPLIGRALDDKYRLEARLGEGGMGTVYRATHLLIDRRVAIKVLNPELVSDEASRERLRREARAAGRLRHPNAVAVTDFGDTQDGIVYIVMELLEGDSLRDILEREAPMDAARAIYFMLEISSAVAAAHEIGIIHRDLKPGNIFIVNRPHVMPLIKVLDFGIAKVAAEASDMGLNNTLTEAGVMIGTPRYMSPEQCDGAELRTTSDVYSLGVIFYEMLTGVTPFAGATPLAVALKHSAELPRPLREHVPAIPPLLETIVLRALEKKPEDRPPNAGAFRRELHAIAEQLNLQYNSDKTTPEDQPKSESQFASPSPKTVRTVMPASQTSEERIVRTAGRETDVPGNQQRPRPAIARRTWASSHYDWAKGRKVWVSKFLDRRTLVISSLALGLLLIAAISFRLLNRSGVPAPANEAVGRVLTPAAMRNGVAVASPEPLSANLQQRDPQTATEYYERGNYFFSTRDYDRAVVDLKQAVTMQNEFATAHNRLGQALLMKGSFAEAAEEFRRAIEQKRNYPEAQYNLGFTLQQQGDAANAMLAYNDAINSRGGTYPDAHYQIGVILLNLKRDREASDALRKAIEQNGGRDPDAYFALGTALARQKDYTTAESALSSAIEQRGSGFAEAHYNLGLLYETTKRPGDAVKEYEIYLRERPDAFNRRIVEKSIRELRRQVDRSK